MKKRLLSLLLAAACLMPLSGCDWGEEPEETYDTLSQYYQQSDSTKQDTRLTSFGLPYLQGETWDPITCADGAQQTLGALLYESLYTLGTDFLPRPCLAESASYDAESYALTVTVRSGVTFSDGTALTVTDTGIGIPQADVDRVFERFYRVDKSHSKEIGGTGLGLSIVKHGALLHNAQIYLNSQVDRGTSIRISFPK